MPPAVNRAEEPFQQIHRVEPENSSCFGDRREPQACVIELNGSPDQLSARSDLQAIRTDSSNDSGSQRTTSSSTMASANRVQSGHLHCFLELRRARTRREQQTLHHRPGGNCDLTHGKSSPFRFQRIRHHAHRDIDPQSRAGGGDRVSRMS
ncbi:hypothetical protein [Saccharopolyspora spinosa]|uniref:hypothetical protein n=1 Tax=Saccharopolyspora spinosa TaxID=60894 RepID=UPI001658EF90|nr:hypothetical protein [Saccharopolyspora spinosa]